MLFGQLLHAVRDVAPHPSQTIHSTYNKSFPSPQGRTFPICVERRFARISNEYNMDMKTPGAKPQWCPHSVLAAVTPMPASHPEVAENEENSGISYFTFLVAVTIDSSHAESCLTILMMLGSSCPLAKGAKYAAIHQ
jgi:hypothetical protein